MRAFLVFGTLLTLVAVLPARGGKTPPAETQPSAQMTGDTHQVVRLWPNGAPGSEGWTQKEIEFGT